MKKPTIAVLLVVAAGAAYWAMGQFGAAPALVTEGARGSGRAVPITVATVSAAPFADRVEAIGTTRANESVMITAKVTDKISRIHFADGARVEKDTLLVELTNDEQSAELAEAKADRDEASVQLKRLEELVQKNIVPVSQVDEARARLSIAEAQLEGIVVRLKDRVIRAPFAGVLGFRQVSPGALVTPGTAITTLDDVSTLKLDFSVPELFLGAINVGDTVNAVSPAYRDEAFQGTVASIGSRVDPVTRSVTVRALVPNDAGALRPGMLMSVELQTASRTSLAVPESAVVPTNRDAYVYVIDSNNIAERRTVTAGQRSDGRIEIVSGLTAGERVAVLGLVDLRDGVLVDVTDAEGA